MFIDMIPKCGVYHSGNPLDGYEYECKYPKSDEVECENCICFDLNKKHSVEAFSPISGRLIILKDRRVSKDGKNR